jgi:hypothetical protein
MPDLYRNADRFWHEVSRANEVRPSRPRSKVSGAVLRTQCDVDGRVSLKNARECADQTSLIYESRRNSSQILYGNYLRSKHGASQRSSSSFKRKTDLLPPVRSLKLHKFLSLARKLFDTFLLLCFSLPWLSALESTPTIVEWIEGRKAEKEWKTH